MAIQMRRGAFTDFDPTQMLPGEWAVMLSDDEETIDGYAVYICYAAGMVKRIVSSDELAALTNNIYADVEDFVNEAFDVETIMLAATNARAAAAEAQAAIDAIGDITEQSVPLMSSSTRGGAKLGVGLEITDGALSVDPDSIEFSTMSSTTRGIAKLGAGLAVSDDALTVDPMSDTQIDDVMAFDPEEDDPITDVEPLTPTGLLYFWGKLKTWAAATFAALSHNHAASEITSGELSVTRGGTGASSASGALSNLGAAAASHNHAASDITSGEVSVSHGGTGKNTHTSNAVLTGNGTSAVKNVATASGALYATSANGEPQFGTLPIAQGGTGLTAEPYIITRLNGGSSEVGMFTPDNNNAIEPGVIGQLPIFNGGTGALNAAGARENLSVLEYSSGVFNVGGTSAYLLFKTTAIASFAPPTGVTACMVLDTSDNGLYWYTS